MNRVTNYVIKYIIIQIYFLLTTTHALEKLYMDVFYR